jgi:ADP-ribosylglycohydrolase
VPARRAALPGNPFIEWIGADIRSDPWGYAAPGWPRKAAELAWRDATLSHRRSGVYGEMYFAAAISAAFAVDDPLEACRIALSEIPARSRMHAAAAWALRQAPKVRDYRHGRELVDRKFPGMSQVHTINNAALTIFGLALGGRDVTKVIGNTVAMGMDNDCTAATAGSIVGAVVGAAGVPAHWTRPFHNRVRTYLRGREWFTIDGIVRRFGKVAASVWA